MQNKNIEVERVNNFDCKLYINFDMGVSKNRVFYPLKSLILIGFSIINHPFWDTPIFGNTHIFSYNLILFIWDNLDKLKYSTNPDGILRSHFVLTKNHQTGGIFLGKRVGTAEPEKTKTALEPGVVPSRFQTQIVHQPEPKKQKNKTAGDVPLNPGCYIYI